MFLDRLVWFLTHFYFFMFFYFSLYFIHNLLSMYEYHGVCVCLTKPQFYNK